tara:strand:+ start:377 stop:1120 length:744 start_codon:yes stop_codon:yes gene_type:complete
MNRLESNLAVVIMAAGKGTRMESDLPKVLHKLSNKTLLNHVIDTSLELNPKKIIVIIGHEAQMVKNSVEAKNILFSLQEEQKGTGHAIMQTSQHLKDFDGDTLILSGDVPLIKKTTLTSLIDNQRNNQYDACMLTAEIDDPTGYGRVIRNKNNNLEKVSEHKDCNPEQLLINEINSGIYIFNNKLLFQLLPQLQNNNAQSEYYLPDVLTMIVNSNGNIGLEKSNNFIEIQGVNTVEQLLNIEDNISK